MIVMDDQEIDALVKKYKIDERYSERFKEAVIQHGHRELVAGIPIALKVTEQIYNYFPEAGMKDLKAVERLILQAI